MRKLKLIITIGITITTVYSHQHKFYGSFGYDFPTTTSIVGRYYPQDFIELNKSTYSEGYKANLGYTFLLNDNFGLDLSFGYLFGIKNKLFSENLYGSNRHVMKYTNSNYSITPSIILVTNISSFSPFVKIGVSLNYINLKVNYDIKDYNEIAWKYREDNYKNDYTVGISSIVGVSYSITNNIFLLTELKHSSVTFFPTEDKMYIDGKYINTFNLLDNYKTIQPVNYPYGETSAFSFDALGVSLGVGITL